MSPEVVSDNLAPFAPRNRVYISDFAARLRANLRVLADIGERSGAKVLAALKAFSMWSTAPIVGEYLDGVCTSGLWEARLASGPWLVGSSVTAADLTLQAFVQHLRRAGGKPGVDALDLGLAPLGARYPALAAWLARIEALPGYERTYPPHWR